MKTKLFRLIGIILCTAFSTLIVLFVSWEILLIEYGGGIHQNIAIVKKIGIGAYANIQGIMMRDALVPWLTPTYSQAHAGKINATNTAVKSND